MVRRLLLDLSELPDLLGRRPVHSHLVHALVELDRRYTAESPGERWEDWYAARIPALRDVYGSERRRYPSAAPP